MLKIAITVLLLACPAVLGSSDEYFQKAVFSALKAKNGEFSSQGQFFENYFIGNHTRSYTTRIEEKHSFRLGSGSVKEFRWLRAYQSEENQTISEEVIYINQSEFHIARSWSCYSSPFDSDTAVREVNHWSSNRDYSYSMMGEFRPARFNTFELIAGPSRLLCDLQV